MQKGNQDNNQDLNKQEKTENENENIAPANEQEENMQTDPIAALSAENEKLAKENAELKERLLRTVAEMENLRKRTARDVAEVRSYAIANFARDMLSATDNLSRALSAVPKEALESQDEILNSLVEGIKMTEREMFRLLQANGVKPIMALGEKFDPHKHQAMFEVEDSDAQSGTIVEELQQGFEIGDRILRPALVGVAKGKPGAKREKKPAKQEDSENISNHIDKKA